MTTSTPRSGPQLSARAVRVHVTDDELQVHLEDGRTLGVPLAWFPRLVAALPHQRDHWELIGRGVGIHWPDLDEDISVENLLGADGDLLMYQSTSAEAGQPSGQRWQRKRYDDIVSEDKG